MDEKYTLSDKFKYFSLRHRKLVVGIFTLMIMIVLSIGVTYSYRVSNKGKKSEFDEIQLLINKIESHDSNIINTYEVREIKKDVRGIDVSGWQKDIDWAKVKAAGIDFAMIRVGSRKLNEGTIVEDSKFVQNVKGAIANDIPVGVYFYSAAKTELEVLEEASFVLNRIKNFKITYPVAYDLENFGQFRLSNVSDERINYNALIFLNYFKSHGYEGMLYGNKTALQNHWSLPRFDGFKIWLAHYVDETSYSDPYDMWQYTESGEVDGIDAYVDMNVASFAYEEINE